MVEIVRTRVGVQIPSVALSGLKVMGVVVDFTLGFTKLKFCNFWTNSAILL